MMPDISLIAKQFTDFYYHTFDTNRNGLESLYQDDSKLTFEGGQIMGGKAIVEKLKALPFEKVEHKVTTQDAQPVIAQTILILVNVTGLLVVDDSQNPLQFSQVFILTPQGERYYVSNDVFRLNYG